MRDFDLGFLFVQTVLVFAFVVTALLVFPAWFNAVWLGVCIAGVIALPFIKVGMIIVWAFRDRRLARHDAMEERGTERPVRIEPYFSK